MLVLTRKKGETIFIGEDIRIVMVSIQEKQARIGIACPRHLSVMRSELGRRIKPSCWPNMTPDEMFFVIKRYEELKDWWTLPNGKDRKTERHDLESFIQELERWALHEFLERYSKWYQDTEHGGNR